MRKAILRVTVSFIFCAALFSAISLLAGSINEPFALLYIGACALVIAIIYAAFGAFIDLRK
jgi:hypothetical protein